MDRRSTEILSSRRQTQPKPSYLLETEGLSAYALLSGSSVRELMDNNECERDYHAILETIYDELGGISIPTVSGSCENTASELMNMVSKEDVKLLRQRQPDRFTSRTLEGMAKEHPNLFVKVDKMLDKFGNKQGWVAKYVAGFYWMLTHQIDINSADNPSKDWEIN